MERPAHHDTTSPALLAEAYLHLVLAWVAVTLLTLQRAARLYRLTRIVDDPPDALAQTTTSAAVAAAIAAAMQGIPWHSSCLVQALAGAAMLKRRRLDGVLYLGVRLTPGSRTGGMAAHAWLRSGSTVLVGAEGRTAYTVIARFRT